MGPVASGSDTEPDIDSKFGEEENGIEVHNVS